MRRLFRKPAGYVRGLAIFSLFAAVALLPLAGQALAQQQRMTTAEINQRVNQLLSKLTLQQKIKLIGGVDSMFTYAMPNIGLPRLKMSDASMGVRVWGPSTAYAGGIGLAASWDPALARKVGVAMGQDALARGVNFILAPGVNIYKLPVDGRNFEFFGEDPYLGSQIAVGVIDGMQSQDVSAVIKHYDANNSEYNRQRENAIISHRALREIYLPIFEAAVKQAHVGAIMNSYNLVNGEHSTQNKWLNITVLRQDWGFRGILMSDWGATHSALGAANGGLDLEMPAARYMTEKNLLPAIKSGTVTEATINEKVRHILYVAVKFGWLNHDQYNLGISRYNRLSTSAALQSAKESMVLLKNAGHLLPLNTSRVHTIALIGPHAYPGVFTAGGSSHVTAISPVSYLEGLTNSLPNTKILWNEGTQSITSLLSPRRGFGGGQPSSNFTTDAAGKKPGLTEEQFHAATFTGKPFQTSVVPGVYMQSGGGRGFFFGRGRGPRQPLSARWTGYYTAKSAGTQEFIVDGGRGGTYQLYVNNKMVLQGLPGRGEPRYVDFDMQAGQTFPVRLESTSAFGQLDIGFDALPAANLVNPTVRKLAAMADVAVVSVGYSNSEEGEGHGRTYKLPPGQVQLIKEVAAANPHTIVVVNAGGAIATEGWLNQVPAFIQAWYGGSEAGTALADVLSGRFDPSGKLPITWWKTIQQNPTYNSYYSATGSNDVHYSEGVFVGYRAYGHDGQPAPLFPFGYGLSYTTFGFSHLTVSPTTASPSGPITVSFDVKNTGRRAGSEVAQVYVSDPSATVPRPKIELKGFERVTLAPGATKHVTVKLDRRSLAYWDTAEHNWKVDPGAFEVSVGSSSENLPLKEKFTVR